MLRNFSCLLILGFLASAALAAVVLSVDVNDAAFSPADTAPGYSAYVLSDNTLSVGGFTVDINPVFGAALDDVHRATPATSGVLTLGALYRDSVFASGDNTANFYRVGLDTVIGGLTPGKSYTLTVWSYDSGSTGARVSDWSVASLGGPKWAANDYTFDGATMPASDAANRFTVTAYAAADGTLTLRGRPAAPSATSSVFLNGFTVDELAAPAVTATPVIALDFNDRANAGASTTQTGFTEFILAGTDASGATSSPTARTFGAQTVTVAPVGGTMDDRRRTTPIDSAPFTESQLLRDFIFASSGASGLDVRVQGLTANATYLIELWSFDTGSASTVRTSDWTVNSAILWDDYGFNGANLPATNNDYKMAGTFTANASGELLISGRSVVNQPNVFLNALRISALTAAPLTDFGRPILSEFLADNANGITDEDGDTSDWIEIWNTTASSLNLAGYRLTDDSLVPAKWVFPSVTLAAQARLRVWASGKNRTADPTALHTNFALSKDAGAYLAFSKPDGTICTVYNNLPAQRSNVSYGLAGSAEPLTAGYFQTPTPSAANGAQVPGFVADTVFDLDRGFYLAPFNVHITCATPNAVIYYTTDGSDPTAGSAVYPGAAGIPITTTTSLRAKAMLPPLAPSNTDTQTYIFNAQVQNQPAAPVGWPATWGTDSEVATNNGGNGTVPADYAMDPRVVNNTLPGYGVTDALAALPALALTLNPGDFYSVGNGIYTNPKSVGSTWERATSMEWLEPAGGGFHTNAGLRIHGNSSRRPYRMQKHSFTLSFKSEYGDGKLNEKLFDDTTVKDFNKLVLHCFFTDGWGMVSWDNTRYRPNDSVYFRDPWMRRSMADMGYLATSGRYAHVYINGLYWGLYEVSERVDENFCADHLGGLTTDWDVMNDFTIGNTAAASSAWASLFAFVNSADLTTQPNYDTVGAQVDLVNFVDYYLLHVHADSEDWPHHNGYAIRNHSVAGDKWRFLPWDQEIVLDPTLNVDRLSTGATDTTTDLTAGRLYTRLKVNSEFRLLFADRAHKQVDNGGPLSLAAEQARWQSFVTTLDKPIVAESARWGDTADATPYGNTDTVPAGKYFTRENDWLPSVGIVQNSHFANLHNPAMAVSTIAELRAQSPRLYPLTEPPAFGQFGGNVPANYALAITAPAGTIYYTLDGTDPRTAYTGVARGTLYSGTVALTQTETVKARALNAGEWSAVTEATFVVGAVASSASLTVTELNYNPAPGDVEFIELMNVSAGTIDLTGVHFEGITFTFANGTQLAPGERIIVTRDQAAFAARYGPGPRVAGQYTGALDNSGEQIAVMAFDGTDIVRFTYSSQPPWPAAANGTGPSLVLCQPSVAHNTNAYLSDPANWRSSTASGGNPGARDSITFTGTPLADTDHDGVPALLEYLLGGSDNAPNDVHLTDAAVETITVAGVPQEYLTLTAVVRPGADGATLSAEWTNDLSATWQPATYLGETRAANGTVSRKWRASVPYSGANQFLRLRAVLAP